MIAVLLSFMASPAAAVTLDEVWAAADENSIDLQLVHEQRVQGDTLRTQALSLLSPKLVLGAHYTINQRETTLDFAGSIPEELLALMGDVDLGEPIVVNMKQYYDWNASVIQPLFNGQAIPLYKGAVDTVQAGRHTERAIRAQVRVGVAQAFWGVIVAREGEKVATRALENARQHLRIAETTVEVGTAAPAVRLQAQLGVARAERQVAVAHEQVVAAQGAFSRLTGLAEDVVVEPPPLRVVTYPDADAAVARALEQRPDIRAATLQVSAGRAQAVASHLAWLPSVDARFTESYSQNSGFSGEPYNWQLVFTGDWVLWDGGARVAQEAKAASMDRAARLQVEGLQQKATESIRTLWEEHTRARIAVEAVDKEVGLAEENLRLADAAFAAGALSFLEVEDARLGLAASQMTKLTETMNRDLTAIRLLEATGDL